MDSEFYKTLPSPRILQS